jgi:hypothetical protein
MAYTDKTTIENSLGRELTTKESAVIDLYIASASNYINEFTGAYFDTVSETTRKFNGGFKNISIDPCHSITKVAIKDADGNISSELASTDYAQYPHNDTVKYSLIKKSGIFLAGTGNIEVTAKFSYYVSKVPDDIKYVTTELVANCIDNSEGINSESIEGYSVTYDNTRKENGLVRSILEHYKNYVLG